MNTKRKAEEAHFLKNKFRYRFNTQNV